MPTSFNTLARNVSIVGACLASPFVLADPADRDIKTAARVDWHQVAAPFGKFLLMKGDKGLCALRFVEYHRGQDAKPPSVFNSGDESHFAQYEWFFQGDGSGDLGKQNVKTGKGRASVGALKGVGRLASQSGDPYVKCGPFIAYWLPPTSVSFSGGISCSRARYQLAPTKWQDIPELNPNEPSLKWFKCDESRKSFRIPIEQL